MQRMMAHHAQALAMTRLVPAQSSREDIRLVGERITLSQQDEIALMRHWLVERGAAVPSPDAQHEHHDTAGQSMSMPGMLTAAELAHLGKATGTEFDQLFLRFMIRHHEGALVMVAEFFATQGVGQDSELFRFASDVDADQRAEIGRMRTMQDAPSARVPRR